MIFSWFGVAFGQRIAVLTCKMQAQALQAFCAAWVGLGSWAGLCAACRACTHVCLLAKFGLQPLKIALLEILRSYSFALAW